jgi:energy-coupling factor transport system permease protein
MAVGYSIYVEKDSKLHREIDPRTKFLWLGTIFAVSLLFNHPLPLGILVIAVIAVGLSSKLDLKTLKPFLLASIWFLVLGVLIWPFYISQGTPVVTVFGTTITSTGLLFGFAMGLRVALMVTTASIVMMSTSPQKMMMGLLKMGIPYKAGMALSVAIRFVPLINAERLTITEAQRTRGLNLDQGNSFTRSIKYVGVIGPLMLRVLDLTSTLAVAMDCRGFGARNGRSSITRIEITRLDILLIVAALIAVVLAVISRILGFGILLQGYL